MKASEKVRRDNIVIRRQTNDLKEETEDTKRGKRRKNRTDTSRMRHGLKSHSKKEKSYKEGP